MELRFSRGHVEATNKTIAGYAIVFYRSNDPGTEYQLQRGVFERIDRAATVKAVESAAKRVAAGGVDVIACYNHNKEYMLARSSSGTLRLNVDNKGLRYEFDIDPNDPDSQRVAAKIARGDLTGSSFQYGCHESQGVNYERENKTGKVIRNVTEFELYDVGPVVQPCFNATSTSVRHLDKLESIAEYERWLQTEERIQRFKIAETQKRLNKHR